MAEQNPIPKTIAVNYLKSSDFREIACDGAIGGMTPQGKLWVAFYAERFPLPRIVEHDVIQGSKPDEITVDMSSGRILESRSGIVRHVEFGVYLTTESAKTLHDWLGKQIAAIGDGGKNQ